MFTSHSSYIILYHSIKCSLESGQASVRKDDFCENKEAKLAMMFGKHDFRRQEQQLH